MNKIYEPYKMGHVTWPLWTITWPVKHDVVLNSWRGFLTSQSYFFRCKVKTSRALIVFRIGLSNSVRLFCSSISCFSTSLPTVQKNVSIGSRWYCHVIWTEWTSRFRNASFWYFSQSIYPIGTDSTARNKKIQIELDFPIFDSGSGSTSTVSFLFGPLSVGNLNL